MLVAITALALGNHAQQHHYLHGALQGGVTENTLREGLSMLTCTPPHEPHSNRTG
jgi:hypothetical protein